MHSPQEGHRAQKPEQLRFIIAIQLCNATAKLIGIIGKVWQVFSSAKPVQLAIIHALEKQRVDVADFFGNNLGDKSYKSMAKAECKLDTVSQKIVLVCLKQGPFHLPLPSSKWPFQGHGHQSAASEELVGHLNWINFFIEKHIIWNQLWIVKRRTLAFTMLCQWLIVRTPRFSVVRISCRHLSAAAHLQMFFSFQQSFWACTTLRSTRLLTYSREAILYPVSWARPEVVGSVQRWSQWRAQNSVDYASFEPSYTSALWHCRLILALLLQTDNKPWKSQLQFASRHSFGNSRATRPWHIGCQGTFQDNKLTNCKEQTTHRTELGCN